MFSALKDCLLKPSTITQKAPFTNPPCLLMMSFASSTPKVFLLSANVTIAIGNGLSMIGPGMLAVDDAGKTFEIRFRKNGNGSLWSPVRFLYAEIGRAHV